MRTYRWPIDIWKDVQPHESSEKCKLKAQWDIVSQLSECLSSINQKIMSAGEDMEKGEGFCTVGGNANWCSHCESSMKLPQKIKNGTALWPRDSIPGNLSKETQNTNLKEHKHPTFIAALFTVTKIWKQPKCPTVDERMKQLWDIYTMEFYSAVKKKKVLPFVTVWIVIEDITLSEMNQSEKDKYHMIAFTCGI